MTAAERGAPGESTPSTGSGLLDGKTNTFRDSLRSLAPPARLRRVCHPNIWTALSSALRTTPVKTGGARDLSREDARRIAENIVGFFSILAEWSRAEVPFSANGNGCFQNKEASRER